MSSISPCTIEEADGRLLLHAQHAAKCELGCITIRTVDSDVVIIATYAFNRMSGIKQLWLDFGVGKSRRVIPVHELTTNIPSGVSENLLIFHCFSGCDTVSSFCSIRKRTAWKAWMSFREVDDAFQVLSTCDVIDDEAMKTVERFVVLMYDRTSTCTLVNQWLSSCFD